MIHPSLNRFTRCLCVVFLLITLATLVDIHSADTPFLMPRWPINLFFLLLFVGFIISTWFLFRGSEILGWFTSAPLALALITVYAFYVMLMGFVPQQSASDWLHILGWSHITSSLAFFLMNVLLMMNLGYVVIKRLSGTWSIRNMAFFLNHAGLFIILAGGFGGVGDSVTLIMPVREGEISKSAYDTQQHPCDAPFAIRLRDFVAQEYAPDILFTDAWSGKVVARHKVSPGDTIPNSFNGIDFRMVSYLKQATPQNDGYISSSDDGAAHAVLIEIEGQKGWLSSGSFRFEARSLECRQFIVSLSTPTFQQFQSAVDLIIAGDTLSNVVVEVNRPISFNGWKIYQSSYDSRMGRWSDVSVFQLVRDPWLGVVYTGIFMLLLGSCYLIYAGRKLGK